MDLEIGMEKEQRALIAAGLAKLLADTYVLYLKTQNFHWNITGPEFYSIHLLLEKQYEEMSEAIDEIAERLRALGFFVEGTFEGFSNLTSLKQEKRLLPKFEMLQHLVKDHELVIRESRRLAEVAEENKDAGTVDLMGRRLLFHEKSAWMLRSQI